MTGYVLIESRDPFESNDVPSFYALATDLARRGEPVTLLLVQNGVLPARRGSAAPGLEAMAEGGVEVLADEFSLRERGIGPDRLVPAVRPAPLEVVIDHLVAGRRAIWH